MPAAVVLARSAGGGFNPLTLAPVLLTHTDDTTVVTGQASAISDRVDGYAFSQATASARPNVSTTEIADHTVWKFDHSTTARRWLSRTDATLAQQLDTSPAATYCLYVKVVTKVTTQAPDWFGVTSNTTSYTNPSIRCGFSGAPGVRFIETAAAINTYNLPVTFSGGWELLAITNDAAGNTKVWLDGVQQGLTVVGTHREPAGMTTTVLGDSVAIGGGDTREYYVGGHFVCLGQLSAANMVNLSNWYASSFA